IYFEDLNFGLTETLINGEMKQVSLGIKCMRVSYYVNEFLDDNEYALYESEKNSNIESWYCLRLGLRQYSLSYTGYVLKTILHKYQKIDMEYVEKLCTKQNSKIQIKYILGLDWGTGANGDGTALYGGILVLNENSLCEFMVDLFCFEIKKRTLTKEDYATFKQNELIIEKLKIFLEKYPVFMLKSWSLVWDTRDSVPGKWFKDEITKLNIDIYSSESASFKNAECCNLQARTIFAERTINAGKQYYTEYAIGLVAEYASWEYSGSAKKERETIKTSNKLELTDAKEYALGRKIKLFNNNIWNLSDIIKLIERM
ncbi:MAG: hypothetical protein ACRCW6_01960, partial [Mycoplasmoidaceae bacterium]